MLPVHMLDFKVWHTFGQDILSALFKIHMWKFQMIPIVSVSSNNLILNILFYILYMQKSTCETYMWYEV